MKSVLRLFKALPVSDKSNIKWDSSLAELTIKRGFVFAPEVIHEYPEDQLWDMVESVGLDARQMNSSFHKSWDKVRDASIEQLVLEQMIHYLTTYGFESLGIYDESSIYIPNEELDIPDIDLEKIKLTVIRGYTKEELKDKLASLLESGIALKHETLSDASDIAIWLNYTEKDIERIKNREAKIQMYEYLDKVPENPVEFLRYVVYKSTGKTLLIKNAAMIQELKAFDNVSTVGLFAKYENKYGLEKLAEIFYRFKPIFLALRVNHRLRSRINKIRRLARKHHKPMTPDVLNSITAYIKADKKVRFGSLRGDFLKALDKANIFRKIRLAYALKYRTLGVDSILYKIRNGKGYAKDFDFDNPEEAQRALNTVLNSIVSDLKPKLSGKNIYIPNYVGYALPATEKQFTGNFPSGTFIHVPKDMIFGVHWNNIGGRRIDLDLSMVSSVKIGWDGAYRLEEIWFSGDMTDASGKKGASELFYIKKHKDRSFLLFVNYYNYNESVPVPFEIIVARREENQRLSKHMVDPNNVLASASEVMTFKQRVLGLVEVYPDDGARFYFTGVNVGNSITSSNKDYVVQTRSYLRNFYTNMISFNQILELAGARIFGNDEHQDIDIDLRPGVLERDTFIKLLTE